MTTVETNTSGGLVPEWTIGDRLRKARTWANISAETMAQAIGRSVRTVSNYETDATPVPLLVIEKYEKLTGIALGWLAPDLGPSSVLGPPTERYRHSNDGWYVDGKRASYIHLAMAA